MKNPTSLIWRWRFPSLCRGYGYMQWSRLDPETCAVPCPADVPASAQRGPGLTPRGENNQLRATHSPEREKKGNRGLVWEEQRQEISLLLFSTNGSLLHRRGCSKGLKGVPRRRLFSQLKQLSNLQQFKGFGASSLLINCLLLGREKACPQNLKYLSPVTTIKCFASLQVGLGTSLHEHAPHPP